MKLQYFFLLSFFPALVFSQQIKDTNAVVYAWTIQFEDQYQLRHNIDTALSDFQLFTPALKSTYVPATLGTIGSPFRNEIYFDRKSNNILWSLNQLTAVNANDESTIYYNTIKPITKIIYIKGGSENTKDDVNYLNVLHTQNISPRFNVGLNYKLMDANSQFAYNDNRHDPFKFFSSYRSLNYDIHGNININTAKLNHSGGLFEDVNSDTVKFNKTIPMLFTGSGDPAYKPSAKTVLRNTNINIHQKLAINNRLNKDSVITDVSYFISHSLQFERTIKRYTDNDPSHALYGSFFFNPGRSNDELKIYKLNNRFKIDLVPKNKALPKLFAGLESNIENFLFFSEFDTLNLNDTTQYKTLYVQSNGDTLYQISSRENNWNNALFAGLEQNIWKVFRLNASGKIHITGYRLGDFELGADLTSFLGNNNWLLINGVKIAQERPSYLMNNYYANNFIWENSFLPQYKTSLSSTLSNSSKKIDLKFHYALFRDLIYINNLAMPEAYNQNLNVISFKIQKELSFWKVTQKYNLTYQWSENEDVISIPSLAFHNTTYLDHTFNFKATQGKIQALVGFDFYYHSKYHIPAYMPSTGMFFNQSYF